MQEFGTARELARRTGKNYRTILRELERGRIPGAIRIGGQWLIHRDRLERFLRGDFTQREAVPA